MALLLCDATNIRGASTKTAIPKQTVQIDQCGNRKAWGAELHACADAGVEHPGWHHRDDTWADLYVNKLTAGSLLAVLPSQVASIQRVPAVEDLNFLPDMGRMTMGL